MRLLTIALLATVALAGCGDGAAPPVDKGGGVRQLKGTVSEGVEHGCLLLTAPDGVYLLVGGDRGPLRPGARVVVTGVVRKDLVTTCQQGTPFLVRTVQPD